MGFSKDLFLRTKVWLTFVTILVVIGAGISWSYMSYQKLIRSLDRLSAPDEKMMLIQNTVQSITLAENYIKSYILTDEKDAYDQYEAEVANITANIDSLKSMMSGDSLQIRKIDSLQLLLFQKMEYLRDFLITKKVRQHKNFSIEALEKINKSTADSIPAKEGIRTILKSTEEWRPIVEQQILQKEIKEPGIWEGIKRLFGTKNIRIDTVTRIENDTVRAIEVTFDTLHINAFDQDTLLLRITQILEEVANKEFQSQEALSAKELQLVKKDLRLQAELSKIFEQIKRNEINNHVLRRNESLNISQNATKVILTIGILGIALGGIFLIAIGRDLTRSFYLSQRLKKEKEKADKLAKVKEEFLAGMSHEIRTPLSSIYGFSELLGTTSLTEDQRLYTDALSKNTRYLIGLVNDILDFSKLDFQKLQLNEEPFDFSDIVSQMQSMFSLQCQEKGLDFKLDIDEKLQEVKLLGDEFRLKQILTNLLGNAVKFTDKGFVELNVQALKKMDRYHLNIKVTDTGKGIEPGKFKSIFNMFEQEDASVTKKYGGTGLGLSIVKKLVESMNGKIMVESRVGERTTFKVWLSLAFVEKEHAGAIDDGAPVYDEVYDAHVVAVDDDKWNVSLFRALVESRVARLSVFGDPFEALDFIKNNHQRIDIIFTDINMPEFSGIELLDSLIHSKLDIPVVAITAHVLPDKIKKFKELGFCEVIGKPYRPEAIFSILKANFKRTSKLVAEVESPVAATPSTEGLLFDFEKIRLFCGNDDFLLNELIRELIESNEANVAEFERFFELADHQGLADLAHKMTQTYDSLNLSSIAESLKNIEVFLVLNKPEKLMQMAAELRPRLTQVREQLNHIKLQYYT
ncbi:MAG: response regulator [Cyclobacteriaceae bacterium]|nr:response regulator [Cyclobacteriaceae bacterium]